MAKSEDRNPTETKIRQAIIRIEQDRPKVVEKGRKMSVSAVAEEAGVSDALIHKEYPAQLERIRGGQDKDIKKQRDEARTKLKSERQKNRELRDKIDCITKEKQELASKNASMIKELKELKAVAKSDNVTPFRSKNTS